MKLRRGPQEHKDEVFVGNRDLLKQESTSGYEKMKWLFLACLIFRWLNSIIVRTAFNPDEYWQSLEVAHDMVFGYGWRTWEWSEGIRSYIHPLIFSIPYYLLRATGLDSTQLIIVLPKLIQGTFTAICDVYVYKLSLRIFGHNVAEWTMFFWLTNWFVFYCMVRTFSNSLETVLTTVALSYWNWFPHIDSRSTSSSAGSTNMSLSLSLAALSVLIRPTSLILWVVLAVHQMLYSVTLKQRLHFVYQCLLVGSLSLFILVAIDSYCYGKFTFILYNFISFNLINDAGVLYGTHPWHWYITQGLPTILGGYLPFFLLGIIPSTRKNLMLFIMIIFSVIVLSQSSHKEFRFLLPLMPICFIISSLYASTQFGAFHVKRWSIQTKTIIGVTTSINLFMAIYFSLFHQSGAISAHRERMGRPIDVHFLMSCHSTPHQSYIHDETVRLMMLDCSPQFPFNPNQVDQTRQFDRDPASFVSHFYDPTKEDYAIVMEGQSRRLPDLIITFTRRKKD
ncbi:hypothetical protein PROFUN_09535 [Planoprotostelium fungivorum]|uniref:Mannosyltransferase n=1 Tax=Planoprotostelium fungivorum TaxID=1890364 RepID=A0A2P6MT06_9EUKA|nr:hypothetical protein PROFUN_09535 [Planoprotostelium fungivorum]